MKKRSARFLFIVLSAFLLGAPYHFPAAAPLAFFAFVPFFYVLDGASGSEALRRSFLFGVLFFLATGHWLALVSVPGFFLLTAYMALYFAVFGVLAASFLHPPVEHSGALLSKNLKAALATASLWTLIEFTRGWAFSGIPWALLAYSQWRNLPYIQIADTLGATGVSFLLLLTNALVYRALRSISGVARTLSSDDSGHIRRNAIGLAAILAGVLFLPLLYGAARLDEQRRYELGAADTSAVRVSVIQGNIPQDQKWDTRIKNIIFEKYKRLTFMSALDKTDLIVWPETSFPGYLEDEPVMSAKLRSLVRHTQTNVLVGTPTLGELEHGLRFYNSAVHFSPLGEETKRYSKLHLVPFGEYVPFEAVLGWVRHVADIGRFSPGTEYTVFDLQTRYRKKNIRPRYAVLICYEDIFPGLVRRFALGGADFLVNLSNDAWFGKTSAPYQHAQASVFRAVENRLPVVRSTNTGLSCFISADGRILATVKEKEEEIFVTGHRSCDIVLRKGRSFYTRFGDLFLLLPVVLLVLAFREKSKQEKYFKI